MKNNAVLGGVALLMLVLSIFSYRQSVTRAERFERGQKFLAQLNADEIDQIVVTKGEEVVTLKRGADSFTVAEFHNYPAKNDTVNRFIRDALEISLEKKVGSGESIEKELEIAAGEGDATEYHFKNKEENTLVRFMVGKSSENGRGNYIKNLEGEDDAVYLTSRGVFLTAKADSFLKKELLSVASSDLALIKGGDYEIADAEGSLKLSGLPGGKQESSKVSELKNILSALRYETVFLADESEVADLSFDTSVEFRLKDQSGYRAHLSKKGDKHYIKLEGFMEIDRISLSDDETEEELKGKADLLQRGEEINKFNSFHGSWIYELTEITANKFRHQKKDLYEDEPKDEEG